MRWERGVAFVRGLNMYNRRRISKAEMLHLCKSIENRQVRIIGVFKTDNILFEKRGVHYATVGSKLERALSGHFGSPVHVTARSVGTLEGVLQRAKSSR